MQARYYVPFVTRLSLNVILPTSFGGKIAHLRRSLVAQPLHLTVSQLRFSEDFLSFKANARRSVHSPQDHFIITLSLATDVTDVTFGVSGHWLGTRTGAGGTATVTKSFFGCSPWLHGQQLSHLIRSHHKPGPYFSSQRVLDFYIYYIINM